MIGDKIDTTKLNMKAAFEILKQFDWLVSQRKIILGIAGESGSGKTYMSAALSDAFKEQQVSVVVLHMDDFFKLPPQTNHQNRLNDISNVGPSEVDLKRIESVINDFKRGKKEVLIPRVNYYENTIEEIIQAIGDAQVLIIEGTYTFYLKDIDFKLFMSRNYQQTKTLRQQRARGNEAQDPFVDEVLKIEHKLIEPFKGVADAWIDVEFNLRYNETAHQFE